MMSHILFIQTIGHSDHTATTFIDLLDQHDVDLVVDVRSQPYSRWAPQFNREMLEHELEAAGIRYRFMGDVLGGRPSAPELYVNGAPDYRRMAQAPDYQEGIKRLLDLAQTERVSIMCSEGDYRNCHRHHLIAQTLLERGARVIHIKADGETVDGERVAEQLSLF